MQTKYVLTYESVTSYENKQVRLEYSDKSEAEADAATVRRTIYSQNVMITTFTIYDQLELIVTETRKAHMAALERWERYILTGGVD